MPCLNHLTCSIELSRRAAIRLPEIGTRYANGSVQTYVAVPETVVPFHIRLCADGYIAPGLAAFVFIDGKYQCNRHRLHLSEESGAMEMLLYQKEEKTGAEGFIAREWTFHKLKTGDDLKSETDNADFVENIGVIEVIVLRCKRTGSSLEKGQRKGDDSTRSHKPAPRSDAGSRNNAKSDILDGLAGIFDGAADLDGAADDKDVHLWSPDQSKRVHHEPQVQLDADFIRICAFPPDSLDDTRFTDAVIWQVRDSGPARHAIRAIQAHLHDLERIMDRYRARGSVPDALVLEHANIVRQRQGMEDRYNAVVTALLNRMSQMPAPDRNYARTQLAKECANVKTPVPNQSPPGWTTWKDAPLGQGFEQIGQGATAPHGAQRPASHQNDTTYKHRADSQVQNTRSSQVQRNGSATRGLAAFPKEQPTSQKGNAAKDPNENESRSGGKSQHHMSVLHEWRADPLQPAATRHNGHNKSSSSNGWVDNQTRKLSEPRRSPDDSHNKLPHVESGPESAVYTALQRPTPSTDGSRDPRTIIKSYWATWDDPTQPTTLPTPNTQHRTARRDPYRYPAGPVPTLPPGTKTSASHGVQAGRGVDYWHKVERAEYLDPMTRPYAVFAFRYRGVRALEAKFKGCGVRAEMRRLEERAERARLEELSQAELVEEMLKVREREKEVARRRREKEVRKEPDDGWATVTGDAAGKPDSIHPSDSASNVGHRSSKHSSQSQNHDWGGAEQEQPSNNTSRSDRKSENQAKSKANWKDEGAEKKLQNFNW